MGMGFETLGMAQGAGEGLDQILTRRLANEKFAEDKRSQLALEQQQQAQLLQQKQAFEETKLNNAEVRKREAEESKYQNELRASQAREKDDKIRTEGIQRAAIEKQIADPATPARRREALQHYLATGTNLPQTGSDDPARIAADRNATALQVATLAAIGRNNNNNNRQTLSASERGMILSRSRRQAEQEATAGGLPAIPQEIDARFRQIAAEELTAAGENPDKWLPPPTPADKAAAAVVPAAAPGATKVAGTGLKPVTEASRKRAAEMIARHGGG